MSTRSEERIIASRMARESHASRETLKRHRTDLRNEISMLREDSFRGGPDHEPDLQALRAELSALASAIESDV